MWGNAKTAGTPFHHSEHSDRSEPADPLSYRKPDGTILRLPNYLPGPTFIEVDQCSGFQIRVKPLFPLVQQVNARTVGLPRFLLQIRSNGAPCYVRRYVASEI